MGVKVITALLVVQLTVSVSSNTAIGRANSFSSRSSNTVHNATIDCGDRKALVNRILQCQQDLQQLAGYGYPWSPRGNNGQASGNASKPLTRKDALDSINHMCNIYYNSRKCLEESGIGDFCLSTTFFLPVQLNFQFICRYRPRDETLVYALQCLHDKRLLAMLYFHIMRRCRGVGILDDLMRRRKSEYFYRLDVEPWWEQPTPPLLYCLPRSAITTCVRGIVQDQCRAVTADFVQNFLLYLQDWFGQALESAGLKLNSCDQEIESNMLPSRPPVPFEHDNLGIFSLLETTAPGTALDTVYGRYILASLRGLSVEELCNDHNGYTAYLACWMSSDGKYDKSKFDILQYAHQLIPVLSYHGTQCGRLDDFTACWNLLQEICGHKVRGLKQHATLMVEGCKIQSELDTAACHWQDNLLEHYINASRVTVWPTTYQGLLNPMSLENTHYHSVSVLNDLDTVISLLQPGVEAIYWQCAPQPANRLGQLLTKLRYLQVDAMKYGTLLMKELREH